MFKIFTHKDGSIYNSQYILDSADILEGVETDHLVNITTEYYDTINQEIKDKEEKEYPITITETGVVILDLPNPSTINIDGIDYIITDGELDLSFDTPGIHIIKIQNAPYLTKEVTIET